jgi:hypothetical protein
MTAAPRPAVSPGPLDRPGTRWATLEFANPTLRDYAWPVFDVRGAEPGPRLCVTAGVHVNEVSSIEAAVRLQRCFPPEALRGSVSIIPVVNLPALFAYTEYLCPVDGKNINFTFPGRPDGTFTEALCHALLHDWARGADCYVDLHGGDLRETVAKFVMYQRVGDAALDDRRRRLAECFDAELVVGFDPALLRAPGRPPTACAALGTSAVMSEAGANGVVDEESVAYHVDGVLNVARLLGMRDDAPRRPVRPQRLCHDYVWVHVPADGMFDSDLRPGARVARGERLGRVRDFAGEEVAVVEAPAAGYVLWRMTQPILRKGAPVLALAVPAEGGG